MEEQLAELGLIAALGLGVLLGLKHSLDPDHVVAVSTIVSEYRNPLRSFWVGISWGLGHTTTLLLIGVVIIALRLTIPERMALLFEFFVGVMLVVYTFTAAIMAADKTLVAAMIRKTTGQGLPVMSSHTLKIIACAPA